jgi:hypothetical protein
MPNSSDQQFFGFAIRSACRILFVVCWSALFATSPSAQQAPPDSPSSSDEPLSERQWRQRVEDARARSAEFVARAKAGTIESLSSDDEDKKVADQRAMNDPSLRAGDIVSTSKGFLVFQGSEDDERQLRDFRIATESEIAAVHRSMPNH